MTNIDYATPGEFVRDLLRQKKLQMEAAAAHNAIVAGYQDAISGRTVPFAGDLRSLLKKAAKWARAVASGWNSQSLRSAILLNCELQPRLADEVEMRHRQMRISKGRN